ncbi:MAG TPA: hypothetical protein PLZ56_07570 [Anaerolineae bacterium]|nr:hypothetical protein [Anaerolineae bacterium]
MMGNSQRATDAETSLNAHAELLRQGDRTAARQLAAAQTDDLRLLMGLAYSLDAALPPRSMDQPGRDRLRRQLVAAASQQQGQLRRQAPLAERGVDLGRRSLMVLRRPDALRLLGAGTAVVATLSVVMLVRRRQGIRQTRQVALGLG